MMSISSVVLQPLKLKSTLKLVTLETNALNQLIQTGKETLHNFLHCIHANQLIVSGVNCRAWCLRKKYHNTGGSQTASEVQCDKMLLCFPLRKTPWYERPNIHEYSVISCQ